MTIIQVLASVTCWGCDVCVHLMLTASASWIVPEIARTGLSTPFERLTQKKALQHSGANYPYTGDSTTQSLPTTLGSGYRVGSEDIFYGGQK